MSRIVYLLLLLGLGSVVHGQQIVKIELDPSKDKGPVNWRVMGQNIEASDRRGLFGVPADAPTVTTFGTCQGQGFWDPQTAAPVPEVLQLSKGIGMRVLRYPGGCLVHRFDWKQTVGPLQDRPDWQFGLQEYLELCKQLVVEPLIIIPDYVGTPQDAADLVEFLNAPATAEHPWAMKRSQWGHPKPYGVHWFELGNESTHGNHHLVPFKQYTAPQYARYFLDTARQMRQVDPTIALGIVTDPGIHADSAWTSRVLELAGKEADFLILHFYIPDGIVDANNPSQQQQVSAACMAVGDQFEQYLQDFRTVCRKACGRDLPLGLTEYNVGQGTMRASGYTMASSVFLIDWLRICLKPQNNVILANHWHMLNSLWGMANTRQDTIKLTSAYQAYQFFAEHLGQRLIQTTVDAPTAEFQGFNGILPSLRHQVDASGTSQQVDISKLPLQTLASPNVSGSLHADGTGTFQIKQLQDNLYPQLVRFAHPGQQVSDYRISFEARFVDAMHTDGFALGIAMQDARGFGVTRSGMVIGGLDDTDQWQAFTGEYHSVADSKQVEIIGHMVCGKRSKDRAVSGKLEIRKFQISRLSPRAFDAYPLVTAMASLSEDRQTGNLILLNKSLNDSVKLEIAFSSISAMGPASLSILAGPQPWSNALCPEPKSQKIEPDADGKFRLTVPACSISALQFKYDQ